MAYAILVNNNPQFWTGHITINGQDIFTNDPTPYGYKELVYVDRPVQEGYIVIFDGWEETETQLIQKWRLEVAPEKTNESNVETPERWRDEVVEMLEAVNE